MRLVEIDMNPCSYGVHAGAELQHYTPEKNQATHAKYHLSDHNCNLEILCWYASIVGQGIHTWSELAFR